MALGVSGALYLEDLSPTPPTPQAGGMSWVLSLPHLQQLWGAGDRSERSGLGDGGCLQLCGPSGGGSWPLIRGASGKLEAYLVQTLWSQLGPRLGTHGRSAIELGPLQSHPRYDRPCPSLPAPPWPASSLGEERDSPGNHWSLQPLTREATSAAVGPGEASSRAPQF